MGQRVKEEENMIERAAAGRGGEGGALRRLPGKGVEGRSPESDSPSKVEKESRISLPQGYLSLLTCEFILVVMINQRLHPDTVASRSPAMIRILHFSSCVILEDLLLCAAAFGSTHTVSAAPTACSSNSSLPVSQS